MILADKIIRLRKKNGYSQEELAEQLNVSRQAVSKWESAQSIPDLSKILQLSELFGVTTDYLLKDEIEDEEPIEASSDSPLRKITLAETHDYLNKRKRASYRIALATFLCILSPITLFILGAMSEQSGSGISESAVGIIGLSVLFLFVLCAVPLYILCGFQNEPYAFLDKAIPFETEYGVRGLVKERQAQFRKTYVRSNILATCLCILSPLPLIVSSFSENEILLVCMLGVLMILAGLGAALFIVVGVQQASMQKLLQEGDFTKQEKKRTGLRETVGFTYWGILIALAIFGWEFSAPHKAIGLIFAIGAVLFPVVMCICNYIADRIEKD